MLLAQVLAHKEMILYLTQSHLLAGAGEEQKPQQELMLVEMAVLVVVEQVRQVLCRLALVTLRQLHLMAVMAHQPPLVKAITEVLAVGSHLLIMAVVVGVLAQ